MLGFSGGATRKKRATKPSLVGQQSHVPTDDLVLLGQSRRDKRSIEEIERDLQAAKMGVPKETDRKQLPDLRRNKADPSTQGKKASLPSAKIDASNKSSVGLRPADFLPGAPIREEMLVKQKLSTKDKVPVNNEAPKKRETARDRFLREEAERRKRQQMSKKSQTFEEEEEEEDSFDDDGEEQDAAPDYREEIWKIFGRDRRK